MNQTNSQMQFLQIVCVVLVMATLISLIGAYIFYRDVTNLEDQLAKAKEQTDACKSDRAGLSEDLEVLKGVMGYQLPEVGEEGSVETLTIVGKVREDIKTYLGGETLARPNLREAMIELSNKLGHARQERDKYRKELDKLGASSASGN